MTEVYLITPISNGPLSFSGTYIIYYLNCWTIYLLFGGRYPALLPVGDQEELILRENMVLWGITVTPDVPPGTSGHLKESKRGFGQEMSAASESRGWSRAEPLPRSPTARSCRLQK